MDKSLLSAFELRLVEEVAAIESRIKALIAEKEALVKQVAKVRSERSGLQTITRKNSLNRVLAESAVLEALKSSSRPMETRQLYVRARETNYDLKTTTFRTYLHRMKKRGLITISSHVGKWELGRE